MDIKINNSNLIITNRDLLREGEKYRYKRRYFRSVPGFEYMSSSPWSTRLGVVGEGGAEWKVLKVKEKAFGVSYSKEEIEVLKDLLPSLMLNETQEVAEQVVFAINNDDLLTLYRKFYPISDLSQFKKEISELSDSESVPIKNTCLQYRSGRRYNILQLVNDLCNSGCYILTDSNILGEYKRISRGTYDLLSGKLDIYRRDYGWSKLLKVRMNLSRANISLTYSSRVTVTIPENESGVKAGERDCVSIKSMCIVCDCKPWTEEIFIRCPDKALLKKLKSVPGLVKYGLLFEDEVALDLTKIPILKRADLRVNQYSIRKAEYNRLKTRIAVMYLEGLEKKTWSKEESFLASLGIYNDNYYYGDQIPEETTSNYEVVTLETTLCGDFSDYQIKKNIKSFKNYGWCRNKSINDILKEVKSSGLSLEDWKKRKESAYKVVGELKFKLIFGKTLAFDLQKKHKCTEEEVEYSGLRILYKLKKKEIQL